LKQASRTAWPGLLDFHTLDNPTTHQHMAEAASLAICFDPHLSTVESVHEMT